jgi:hypothetical protein
MMTTIRMARYFGYTVFVRLLIHVYRRSITLSLVTDPVAAIVVDQEPAPLFDCCIGCAQRRSEPFF